MTKKRTTAKTSTASTQESASEKKSASGGDRGAEHPKDVPELEIVPSDDSSSGDSTGDDSSGDDLSEDELDTDDLEGHLSDDGFDDEAESEDGGDGDNPGAAHGKSTDLPSRTSQSLPRPYRPSRGAVGYQDPLQLYLREISAFPLLKPDEEKEFARRVRDTGDSEAAFRLVSSHLRLVVKIAMDFQRRWMQNVLDLIQEGNVGLMRAVQKFDPEKGIKFSYYAAFWIKAYILKFIMDNWRLVKIGTTQAQRKLFYNLNKERQRLKTMGFDADTATISRNLGVTEDQVREMEQRLDSSDMSLDVNVGEDSTASRIDFLPALGPGIEQTLADDEIARSVREQLESIIPTLSDKEVDILQERLLSDSPTTLREIGEKYGITRERVRQLETRLLKKLRDHLSSEIGDFSRDWIVRDD